MSNQHTPVKPPEWVIERIQKCLAYDKSVRGVVWIARSHRASRVKIGAKAGSVYRNGYRVIGFAMDRTQPTKEIRYVTVSHIVWFLCTGEWPTTQVDHKDTDRKNDTFENLRYATNGDNVANAGVRSNSTSGVKNIRFLDDCPEHPYRVHVRRAGRPTFVGWYATLDEAIAVRDAVLVEYHGEFANSGDRNESKIENKPNGHKILNLTPMRRNMLGVRHVHMCFGKFRVGITRQGQRYHSKCFDTLAEAVADRDAKLNQLNN